MYIWKVNQKQLRYDVRNSLVIKTVLFPHQKQGKDKWSIKQDEQGMQMIYNVTADIF